VKAVYKMSFLSTIVKNFKEFYSEINGATLTGAIDVVVVEQEDGTFKSTPFHVRFGKLGVMKSREKIVDLEINGEPVDIQMKLDDSGVAFFVETVDSSDDWTEEDATSPIANKTDLDIANHVDLEVELCLNGTEKEMESFPRDCSVLDEIASDINLSSKKEPIKKIRKQKQRCSQKRSRRSLIDTLFTIDALTDSTDDMFDMDEINDFDSSDKEYANNENLSESDFLLPLIPSAITKDLEALLFEPDHEKTSPGDSVDIEGDSVFSESSSLPWQMQSTLCLNQELGLDLKIGSANQNVFKWDQMPSHSTIMQYEEELKQCKIKVDSNKKSVNCEYKEEPIGVYLDDIVDNLDLHSIYLNHNKTDAVDPLKMSKCSNQDEELNKTDQESLLHLPTKTTEARRIERFDSGCELYQDNQSCDPDLPPLLSSLLPDLAASLCGGLTAAVITPEQFAADIITFPHFVQQLSAGPAGSLLNHKQLVIRVHEKYLSWEKAAPILFSVILFGQPLSADVVGEIIKDCLDVNITMTNREVSMIKSEINQEPSSWREWFSRTPKEEVINIRYFESDSKEINTPHQKIRLDTESSTTSSEDSSYPTNKKFRKTLRLSSERLADMNLKPGCNEVQFSVTTAFQGTSRCSCNIFLWHHTDKVVISDIDGTITKSDVLGHLLPVIGRDWAQSGVAQLFTKIRSNRYHMMYLSARAIGQATSTKEYLQSVKQGDVSLPNGPLFLNPDSLIYAFKREVIDRNPEEFKISCLNEIKSLFGDKNPFFAGYGNRPNVRIDIFHNFNNFTWFHPRMLLLTDLWVFHQRGYLPSTQQGSSSMK